MSRIGRKPISIPEGVKVTLTDGKIKADGPKGIVEQKVPANIKITVDTAKKLVSLEATYNILQDKIQHGTIRSIINNMLRGVHSGYERKLEINGIGYKAQIEKNTIIFHLGFSHPIRVSVPQGITVTIPNPNLVVIQGADRELVGRFSASIKALKSCEPYNLKGIKYSDEIIKKKAGKTFVSGTT
jgi:large subunit ribosomal protein L6